MEPRRRTEFVCTGGAGSISTYVAVPGSLTVLTPRSTVHFRVVSTSAIRTAMCSYVTLTTLPFPRVTTPIRSGFSLFPSYTLFTLLKVLLLPSLVTIQLLCNGSGCFKLASRSGYAVPSGQCTCA